MAEITQSDFDQMYLRRALQDGEDLLAMLKEDGEITVVADPVQKEEAKKDEAEASKSK